CSPLRVKFLNHTTNVTSYRWIFSDGTEDSYEEEPVHIFKFPGTWSVTLMATGPGGTSILTKEYLITTYPQPYLEFESLKREKNLPAAVFKINNYSTSTFNYWELRDSNDNIYGTSDEMHPEFTIHQEGRYGIQLIGTNEYGCSDTLFKPTYLSVNG